MDVVQTAEDHVILDSTYLRGKGGFSLNFQKLSEMRAQGKYQ